MTMQKGTWFGAVAAISLSVSGAAPVWHSGMLKEAVDRPNGQRAVTDKTLSLAGSYAYKMDSSCLPEQMKQFSVSAWVKPDKFDHYNEIFRIESNKGRVLFAFQEKGLVLALGLDVNGGYQECDAPIRAEALLDKDWHFAAATFDGQTMRVFLDGMFIGALPHPGTAAVARAPGFVGSVGGTGEFFQGGIDDLRLYTECLSSDALTALMNEGAAKLEKRGAKPKLAAWRVSVEEQLRLATEYLPITEEQWSRCSPAEWARWKEVQAHVERINATLTKGTAKTNKNLLDEINQLAASAPERPTVRERVAPYVVPATPTPRTYTRDEARQTIERDWLFQVGGKPDLNRELARTRKIAERLGTPAPELDKLAAALAEPSLSDEKASALYFAIRNVRRALMLSDPAVDFKQLLLVDMPYPQGSEWNHETRHRLGYMAVPGGQLLVVDGLSLDGPVRRIMPQAPLHGSFWRPDLSFPRHRGPPFFFPPPHQKKQNHNNNTNTPHHHPPPPPPPP
ncbi:MAG: LamG domain-containing protein, partial [Kiritimatiellaeota bacterium]|nr:LamG domain-containing protein [Kiritimatiellota bacterium]